MSISATISADIIKSTSLSREEIQRLQDYLRRFIDEVEDTIPGTWGRLTRGDNIEIVLSNREQAMQVAVMLKCCVRAFTAHAPKAYSAKSPYIRFLRYGVRIAIGIGSLRLNDAERGLIDGRAIYNSGLAILRKSVVEEMSLGRG